MGKLIGTLEASKILRLSLRQTLEVFKAHGAEHDEMGRWKLPEAIVLTLKRLPVGRPKKPQQTA